MIKIIKINLSKKIDLEEKLKSYSSLQFQFATINNYLITYKEGCGKKQ